MCSGRGLEPYFSDKTQPFSAAIFTVFSGQIGSSVSTGVNLTYNNATGVLAYDADGPGPVAPLTFAILGLVGHPTLLGNDFFIVA